MRKDEIAAGMVIGIISTILTTMIMFGIAQWLDTHDYKKQYDPNNLLNSEEWRIDTTKHITGKDTTITYKFVPIKE